MRGWLSFWDLGNMGEIAPASLVRRRDHNGCGHVSNIVECVTFIDSSIHKYHWSLLLGLSPSPPLNFRLKVLVTLQIDLQRLRDREEIDALSLEPLESFRSSRFRSVDAEDFDAVAGRCDVKVPVPRTSHVGWLCVQGVVPTPGNHFEPKSLRRQQSVLVL